MLLRVPTIYCYVSTVAKFVLAVYRRCYQLITRQLSVFSLLVANDNDMCRLRGWGGGRPLVFFLGYTHWEITLSILHLAAFYMRNHISSWLTVTSCNEPVDVKRPTPNQQITASSSAVSHVTVVTNFQPRSTGVWLRLWYDTIYLRALKSWQQASLV